jgi:hypothetical protein
MVLDARQASGEEGFDAQEKVAACLVSVSFPLIALTA